MFDATLPDNFMQHCRTLKKILNRHILFFDLSALENTLEVIVVDQELFEIRKRT